MKRLSGLVGAVGGGQSPMREDRAMELGRLDHVNIRTANLDEMVRWYVEVMGMHSGDRPNFRFPGAWLYVDGFPIVHLVSVPAVEGAKDPTLEHYAIQAKGLADWVKHLTAHGVAHTLDEVPGLPVVQINLRDPDGNHIHIDFDTAEMADLG